MREKMMKIINLLLIFITISCIDNSEIEIIQRSEWDAFPPVKNEDYFQYCGYLSEIYNHIVIHHSSFPHGYGPKQLQEYEMFTRKFNDIAYHFIIGKTGKIYEGRKLDIMGAHAGQTKEANELAENIKNSKEPKLIIEVALKMDPDYGSIGICLTGNFHNKNYKPTKRQLSSLKKLLIHLAQKYNISQDNILMHKDVKSELIEKKGYTFYGNETLCPGKNAYQPIVEIIDSLY